MKTYVCSTCGIELEGLSAAANHTKNTPPFRSHPTSEVKPADRYEQLPPLLRDEVRPQITGFTFISTKLNGDRKRVEFGDLDTLPVSLAQITKETTGAEIANMIGLAFSSSMNLDDQINLVHTICHSAKYAGLVASTTI